MAVDRIRPWRNLPRRAGRQIVVGDAPVGGDTPISVQSLTDTPTHDAEPKLEQIERGADLEGACTRSRGCDDRDGRAGPMQGAERARRQR